MRFSGIRPSGILLFLPLATVGLFLDPAPLRHALPDRIERRPDDQAADPDE
ncbi:MAG: hypothetical protein M0Z62_06070 [Actinomycetota bacterium]|nr:hypothetical protein [Actinomycetota bacterium]